ncbi:unnamed protein product [Albugo candida]|uniref:Peptidase A1 domain-containing protein n=1 Tax=Albugo candida TaxID=65357 RepID=A0A024FT38_9STRA|nr:unnamed protein product [Albugo candida]|eukprot:CCI10248.1 unnamed protein product [Albugo candida]
MRATFLQISAFQVLQQINVTYADVGVRLVVLYPSEKNYKEGVVAFPAINKGNNVWELEGTSFDAEILDRGQLHIHLKNPRCDPFRAQLPRSNTMNCFGKYLSKKHDHEVDEQLPTQAYTTTVIFSTDIVKALQDSKDHQDVFVTFEWKELQEPTLYFGTIGARKLAWLKSTWYTSTPADQYFPMNEEMGSTFMLGPLDSGMMISTGGAKSTISGRHSVCFDFAKVISEVPQEIYDTIKAHLLRLVGSDTSFACHDKSLDQMPSIIFTPKSDGVEYKLTSREYIMKMPGKDKVSEAPEEDCFMAIVPTKSPCKWVFGATFAKRYSVTMMKYFDAQEYRVYLFTERL